MIRTITVGVFLPNLPEKCGPGTALALCCLSCGWDTGNAGVGPEVQRWRRGLWRTDIAAGRDCRSERKKSVGSQTLSFLGLVKKSVNS